MYYHIISECLKWYFFSTHSAAPPVNNLSIQVHIAYLCYSFFKVLLNSWHA